jgi:hypothetical protein
VISSRAGHRTSVARDRRKARTPRGVRAFVVAGHHDDCPPSCIDDVRRL